jgi:hypothetical protein
MESEDPWAAEDSQAIWGDAPSASISEIPPVVESVVVAVAVETIPEPAVLVELPVEQPEAQWDPLSPSDMSQPSWSLSPPLIAAAEVTTRVASVAPITALSLKPIATQQPLTLQITENIMSDPLNALALESPSENVHEDAEFDQHATIPDASTTTIDAARYDFEIQVTDPQKIGDALHLSAHVIYKVKTRVCLSLHALDELDSGNFN